jgi:hypothetical protein
VCCVLLLRLCAIFKIMSEAESSLFELPEQKRMRLDDAACRKLRRLSGWNVYQREHTTGGLTMVEVEYTSKVRGLGKDWNKMSVEEKMPYRVKAEYENTVRANLMETPLPVKGARDVVGATVAGKEACKKISAHRLGLNDNLLANHPSWGGPLGLSDFKGALKASLINMQLGDEEIDAQVREWMCPNKPRLPFQEGDGSKPHDVCFHRFGGMCKDAPHCKFADSFVKQFGSHLQDSNVMTGALLEFSANALANSTWFFLGVVVKKPKLHVLLKADSIEGMVHLATHGGLPYMYTSNQVFQKMFEESGVIHQLLCTEHSYTCNSHDLPLLQVASNGVANNFEMFKVRPKKPRRPKPTLPFGMKAPCRKRAARKKGCKPAQRATAAMTGSDTRANGDSSSDRSADSSPVSSSSSSSSASSDENGLPPADRPNEVVAAPSHAIAAEEVVASGAVSEVLAGDAAREQVARGFAAGEIPYFLQHFELGLHEGGIAPTSGSTCYHCSDKIPKGKVRFSYYWHVRRPSRWIDADCLPNFISKHLAMVPQIRGTLHIISLHHPDANVASKAKMLHAELQAKFQSGTASSSSSSSGR